MKRWKDLLRRRWLVLLALAVCVAAAAALAFNALVAYLTPGIALEALGQAEA